MEQGNEEMIIAQIEKAIEKLNAAKSLLKEGFVDDAISRAYYCIFHSASALLFADGITVKTHDGLKTMFGLHFVKTGKVDEKYARWLSARKR